MHYFISQLFIEFKDHPLRSIILFPIAVYLGILFLRILWYNSPEIFASIIYSLRRNDDEEEDQEDVPKLQITAVGQYAQMFRVKSFNPDWDGTHRVLEKLIIALMRKMTPSLYEYFGDLHVAFDDLVDLMVDCRGYETENILEALREERSRRATAEGQVKAYETMEVERTSELQTLQQKFNEVAAELADQKKRTATAEAEARRAKISAMNTPVSSEVESAEDVEEVEIIEDEEEAGIGSEATQFNNPADDIKVSMKSKHKAAFFGRQVFGWTNKYLCSRLNIMKEVTIDTYYNRGAAAVQEEQYYRGRTETGVPVYGTRFAWMAGYSDSENPISTLFSDEEMEKIENWISAQDSALLVNYNQLATA